MPLITLSDYALPVEQMPENAAQLVDYLNSPADSAHPWAMKRKQWGHPEPYNVTWFELGNESMHGNHRLLPRRQYSAEQYADFANATAAAMRKVDPRVKLGIVLMPGPGLDVDCDWNQTVVRRAGASADFAIVHMYAPQGPMAGAPDELKMQAMMVAPQHIEERLQDYHRMIRGRLGHDLPLAITEFDGTIDQPAYSFTLASALECADLLRVFLKPEINVAMANYWDFLNSPFGMLKTNLHSADGKPETEEPAFLLYRLWAEHFGSRLAGVEVNSPRADFVGLGTEQADKGNVPDPKKVLQQVDLAQNSSLAGTLWPKLLNVQIQLKSSDLTVHLQGLNKSIYPLLATIPPAGGRIGNRRGVRSQFRRTICAGPGKSDRADGYRTHRLTRLGADPLRRRTRWNHQRIEALRRHLSVDAADGERRSVGASYGERSECFGDAPGP